jgi:putative heme-binding domain-containing protein
MARSRVPQVWDEDHLLGRMPDARGHNVDRMAPGGFVLSFNPDGKDVELIATGFRNPYDIALNRDGELFAYDADMEWDVGTPWYRPTRINHVISGSEFGWRNGTGKWPAYYPDSYGAAVDIGPGSPTGICFGYGAKFPKKYQDALFICDWSYGNIHAVHLNADGSTYGGTYETFATAAPLPVTDIVVRPEDGMLYFTIGGRKTQSGLYRIRYTGNESIDSPAADATAKQLRNLRSKIEATHVSEPSADNLALALQNLGHVDRGIQFAARIALEHQPVDQWRTTVLELDNPQARILGVIALARHGAASDQAAALSALNAIDFDELSTTHRTDLLRAYGLVGLRLGKIEGAAAEAGLKQIGGKFPTGDNQVDRELAQMLAYLEAADAVPAIVAEMKASPSQENQIHYAMTLRAAKQGWTPQLHEAYFQWFTDIQSSARGGMSFGGFIENIKKVALERLPEKMKTSLAAVINPPAKAEAAVAPRPVVKEWTVDDLVEYVSSGEHHVDFNRGKEVFAAGQCYKCHRMGVQGGILGPDLTAAGGRFSVKDLLVSMIEPSKETSDQYSATQFLTDDGKIVVGRIVNMNGNELRVMTNMLDPADQTAVNRDSIQSTQPAKASMMPDGLLNTFTKEEIADLVAYLRSGGRNDHQVYQQVSVNRKQWLEFPGGEGPGAGKHIVLIAGDHEYRSEEALPQLGKILSVHHGFKCTVLFPIDPATGEINPESETNIPGLEALKTADLAILGLRFRNLDDEQMQIIVDYAEAGKPMLAMRTSTHPFNIPGDRAFAKYSWNNQDDAFKGGFGKQIFGETWVSHHGKHGSESTRGLVADPGHPIATGIKDGDIWGPTDVYGVHLPLTGDGHAVFNGQILTGMNPNDEPVADNRNDPLMPIGWTRTYKGGRMFTTTMGSADDLPSEGVRRMLVNAAYWCMGLEDKIQADSSVAIVGEYTPTKFGFGKFIPGKFPSDYDLQPAQ